MSDRYVVPLSPSVNFVGSALLAVLIIWGGIEAWPWASRQWSRFFHIGYQEHRGTILEFSYDVRRLGSSNRGRTHSYVAQPVILLESNGERRSFRPDNGYMIRGFAAKFLAEADAAQIGVVGGPCVFLANADFSDSFLPISSDRAMVQVGVVGLTYVVFAFCAAGLLFNCVRDIWGLPKAIRAKLAKRDAPPPETIRTRRRRCKDGAPDSL